MNILVTGATGFVGSRVMEHLSSNNKVTLIAAIRKNKTFFQHDIKTITLDDLGPNNLWGSLLNNVDVVIHAAARVHIMKDSASDPLLEFRRVNVEGTLNLARQAAKAGVERFVFISSIKVNGESTPLNKPFTENHRPSPVGPYGVSKFETEEGLFHLAHETGMEVVCIRPVLVYGPGVTANFASMLKWLSKSIPLPFGAISNQRSLVALDNLASFICLCADREKAPKAANQVFLISDDEDVSTTQLLRKVGRAFDHHADSDIKARLMPVPVFLMSFVAKLLGKGAVANRLFGSLQVDSSKARDLLGWKPVTTMDEQLKKTVDAYLENEKTL